MKQRVVVTVTVDVEIPDEKIDGILMTYRQVIDSRGVIEDLFEQVAYSEVMGYDHAEGIGDKDEVYSAEVDSTDTQVEDEW